MPDTINNFVGVLKDPETLESISKKFGVSLEALMSEMEIGMKIEKEHTEDEATAGVIVLHHLAENPAYYSKGEFKNEGDNAWPKSYKARHLEPGLVHYADIGEKDPVTGNPKGMTLLLTKEAIDRMRPSFKGKPVVNWYHKSVKPDDFKKGNADGVITGASYNSEDGWDWVEFLVWDSATKENCDKGFRLSCAYVPTDIKIEPGIWHNIPYDGEVISGVYTHMAIVDNPRYERSLIMANSLGGKMKGLWTKFLNKVTGKPEAKELDNKIEVDMDGKKISLEELVNSFKAEKAEKEKLALENSVKEMKDDSIISIDGDEVSIKDLKSAHAAFTLRKNAMDEAEEKSKKEKEEAERKNSEEESEKKKAEDEKRNADEKAAADKAEADKKALEEKRNADEKNFLDLKNAAEKGGEVKKLPAYESANDKMARGKTKYGEMTAEKK